MAQAGDFPSGYPIAGQHGREHPIDNIWFGGAETSWGGHNRRIVLITQEKQIARLYRGEKPLDLASCANHGAADDIFWTCRGGCGRH